MIYYIIEKNNRLDFENPLDVETPFSFNLKTIKPSTKIYLIDYTKINGSYYVKSIFEKSALTVVKSICNLYPHIIFSLNEEFLQDKTYRSILLKTCMRTLVKRNELKSKDNTNHTILFEKKFKKYLEDLKIEAENEFELV